MLRRIRRRARGLAAVEGAIAFAAVGLGGLALSALAARARGGGVGWRDMLVAGGASALAGAALGAARTVTLWRCARLLDAALDRGARPHDRALSALAFADAGDASLLARAALADAVKRGRAVAPGHVAPFGRPRALPALGGAALALLVVSAWPARAPGARRDAGLRATTPAAARLVVAPGSLDAERADVVAASTAADAAGDVSLAALSREARAALDALESGALGRGEALDRLTALAARAKEAAEEAAAAQSGARAAGKSLEATAPTRALGRALSAGDPEAVERAVDALAARGTGAEAARNELARALGAAASGVAAAARSDDAASGPADEGRRRLDRPRDPRAEGAADAPAGNPGARRLEHLRRDLDETAAACHADARACASRLGDGALPRASREGAEAPARRRLEDAVRQVRERLRRGELEGGAAERRFARVARGERGEGRAGAERTARGAASGAEGGGAVVSDGAGAESEGGDENGGDDVFAEARSGQGAGDGEGEGEGASEGGGASAGAERGAGAGQGAGNGPGGEPLGRESTPPTRGHDREVRVHDGAGPTRSEVIEASARRGFAARDYVRVFSDYQPVVEEALVAGAVPEGRRYVVRRYFQLIRPRAGTAAPRSP
jgi:hypothetical protein